VSTTTVLTPAEVLADLIAEGVRRRQGGVGVLVRDVPAPDPNRLLRALAELRDEGMDLRIAYLREGGLAAAEEAGFNADNFSTAVETAEIWRNKRDLTGAEGHPGAPGSRRGGGPERGAGTLVADAR
jgi:hypothetical protein